MSKNEEVDAVMSYLLSKRQGVTMIAELMGKTEAEVERLIAVGRTIMEGREEGEP